MEIILIILSVIFLFFGFVIGIIEKDPIGFVMMFFGILLIVISNNTEEKPYHRVYEKASDMPYWELSEKQFKSDTITIDTLYYNCKTDTVYRTIHYIVTDE